MAKDEFDESPRSFFYRYLGSRPQLDHVERGEKIHEAIEQMLNAEWTTEWPKEEGWYWTWQKGHRDSSPKRKPQDEIRPTEVRLAGMEPKKFWMYVRDGAFLYPQEQREPIWWLPLQLPLSRPPEGT